ncbi:MULTISPECIES: amino acid ABC transporter permease [Geobacter]|uniref:Amino acid ABC transporter permease n=2 Tax=Geobacter TaxID=28231 RepID=A0A0C1QLM6_9BACT|nr:MULTISPECIES: amino acid ABC transporter permease [Geobacter]ANA39712.1 amino acid ABC transporter permease [Geobacter anodireducens]KIE41502.1 amino acid ABC transporter permease [Geobacter soli]MBE2888096.1 amino acid ABC transporter permease [Geobacter anodireducens]HMN02278.1 amino acid ABC transporter permease [Geobacter anodireducens]
MNLLFAPHDCREGGAVPLPARIVGILIAFFLVTLIFAYAFHTLQYHWGWESVYAYRQKFINGWLMTLAISAAALFLSFAIGFCTALAQRSRLLPLRYLGRIYVETIRGTPLLVQILVFFYVVADAFGVSDRYLVGVITLSLFAGAYISEMIRAGIESVGDSQMESARAIGLTRAQIYRYVVFPQAFRQTIPPLAGQFASIVKDSSLLSIIAVSEFTLNAQEVNAFTYSTLESYLPLAIGYLAITLPISLLSRRLEKKFRYAT